MARALEQGKGADAQVEKVPAEEPAFILYTSGTMAKPKGTVQPHGSYQVYIHAMGKWVYNMDETDIWWSTSDIGWIVGHSYVVYAPLLFGCTTIMYEGLPDHPSPDIWWRIIERNKVSRFWISPTGVRALMKYGDDYPKKYDLSSLKLVACAGEVLNPPAWEWLQKKVLADRIPCNRSYVADGNKRPTGRQSGWDCIAANKAGLSSNPTSRGGCRNCRRRRKTSCARNRRDLRPEETFSRVDPNSMARPRTIRGKLLEQISRPLHDWRRSHERRGRLHLVPRAS